MTKLTVFACNFRKNDPNKARIALIVSYGCYIPTLKRTQHYIKEKIEKLKNSQKIDKFYRVADSIQPFYAGNKSLIGISVRYL